MLLLGAAVAVHSVRVYHEVELLAGLLKGIDELEGVLEMHIVIAGTMGELQHDRLCTGIA